MSAPRSSSRDLALIATFAGVVAALGLVPAFTPPGFAVPITAQSLGVMLAGAVRSGEVWVRSPFVCTRYDGPPGPLRRDVDGFCTVGDLSLIHI